MVFGSGLMAIICHAAPAGIQVQKLIIFSSNQKRKDFSFWHPINLNLEVMKFGL